MECCLPILDRLARRDRVEVDLVLNKRMLKTDPELSQVLSNSPISTRLKSRISIELLSYWDMRRADAILSYGDPTALHQKTRPRDQYLTASGTPSIFVQHGMIQEGVNLDCDWLGRDWYASLILWWAHAEPERTPFITDDVRKRVKSVGYIKKNLMPRRNFPDDLLQFINKFEKKILVCTSIPRDNNRFADESLQNLARMLDEYCSRNPKHLVMLRPHRARKTSLGVDAEEPQIDSHENLIVMDRHSGPFAYSTIHHSLQLSDMVVSHASSAILDAIYADQPTAVMQNDWQDLEPLHEVHDLHSLEQFVAAADKFDTKNNIIRKRFGELETNLDRAAELIEGMMLKGSVD